MNPNLSSRSPRAPGPERRGRAARLPGAAVVLIVLAGLNARPALGAVPGGPVGPPAEASLRQLVEAALESNPEIAAATARWEASRERPPQAGSLPDPMVKGMYRNVGFPRLSLGDEMMSVAGVGVTQGIPYPGKRGLRAGLAGRGVDVAAARMELLRRRVVRDVVVAFYELDFLHRAIDTVAENRAWLEQLERTAEARYSVGQGIQQDVLKAQVEVSALLQRLVILEQQRDSVETDINRLLDRASSTGVEAPRSTEAPGWDLRLDELQAEAASASALLRERGLRVEQGQAALDLAVKDRMPDFEVSTAWMSRAGLPDMWEVSVGVGVPIWRSSKQDRAVEESRAELRATRQTRREAQAAVEAAIRDLYLRAERASRLMELFRDAIVPQATLSLESATAGYEVGKVDFLTVLDNVVKLLTFEVEYQRQRASYLQALARLEEYLGRSLGATPEQVWDAGPHDAGAPAPAAAPASGGRR